MNIGIIGAGNIAKKMAHAIRETDEATFYGVASRSLSKAETFAQEHGAEHAYGSYQAMVEDPTIELVYIATPHSQHYEHAKLALLHDKHVLCEKSFVVNRQQLTELIAIADERQLTLVEAIWTRFLPLNQLLKEWVASGKIGIPKYLSGNLSYPISHIERMYTPELAGGALLDLGVYTVHFALAMFGNDVKEVTSVMDFYETGVDSQEAITLHFSDGKIAQIASSMIYQSDNIGKIFGTDGYIEVLHINHAERISLFTSEGKLLEEHTRQPDLGGFEFQLQEMITTIQSGHTQSLIVTHEDSLKVMEIMDTVRQQNNFVYPFEID